MFRRTGSDRQRPRARHAVGYSGSLDRPLLDGLTELNSLVVVVKQGVLPCPVPRHHPVPRIVDVGLAAIQAAYECMSLSIINFRVTL